MKHFTLGASVAASLLLAGCPAKKSNPLCSVPSASLAGKGCDPMVPQLCGLPFPSNVYLAQDESTPTCGHVAFSPDMLPTGSNGMAPDPKSWSDSDGFSPGQGPMTYIAGATTTGFPTQNTIGISVQAGSPTVLLDTSTNPPTLVPHFAELDISTATTNVTSSGIEYDTGDQMLMIRPVVRLKDATRYIVAIRNVQDMSGNVIAPSPVFQALRDGTSSSDPTVASRRALYADIFSKLAAAGIDKSNLQIAWDYTTASQQSTTGQLVSMRDQALQAIGSAGPQYTITSHLDMPDAMNPSDEQFTARTIEGTVHVPLFLDSGNVVIDPPNTQMSAINITTGYQLQRDSSGTPRMNGYADFYFIVQIPLSVWNDTQPAPILIQGHGLFSDRTEGQDSTDADYNYFLKLANEYKYVTVAVDLIGWRTPGSSTDPLQEDDDEKAGGFVFAPVDKFRGMIDRGTQGMLNQLVALRMMETSLAKDPLTQNNGHALIDTTTAYYRGDSQGGTYGATFMSLVQDIKRGYLGEPGLPYSFLIMRSADFAPFLSGLDDTYPSAKSVQIGIGLMQMFWDRLEGDGFAPYITDNPLPSTPSHNILINCALGDNQVTPLGAEILARTVGAQNLEPLVTDGEVYGITDSPTPVSGNGLVIYDFGLLTNPMVTVSQGDIPPTCTNPDGSGNCPEDPHDLVRQQTPTYIEQDTWFRTGVATNECGGPCVFSEQN